MMQDWCAADSDYRFLAIFLQKVLTIWLSVGKIFSLLTRGGAVWQLVGLITRRSQVQILPPQPGLFENLKKACTRQKFCFIIILFAAWKAVKTR